MKKLCIFIAFCVPLAAAIAPSPDPGQEITLPTIRVNTITHTEVVRAIIYVESAGNDKAYRSSEDAVGCLQIRKTMVRDVNRILKLQGSSSRYKYKDRWCRAKSIEMFNIYTSHYNLQTPEEKARCWNGGPRGSHKKSTVRYWKKVREMLYE